MEDGTTNNGLPKIIMGIDNCWKP